MGTRMVISVIGEEQLSLSTATTTATTTITDHNKPAMDMETRLVRLLLQGQPEMRTASQHPPSPYPSPAQMLCYIKTCNETLIHTTIGQ